MPQGVNEQFYGFYNDWAFLRSGSVGIIYLIKEVCGLLSF